MGFAENELASQSVLPLEAFTKSCR